jgi:hypothetical protein
MGIDVSIKYPGLSPAKDVKNEMQISDHDFSM